MKRIIWLVLFVSILGLTGCTSEDQQFYENVLQRAQEKIIDEDFSDAKNFLEMAVTSGHDDVAEAEDLLEQLEQYDALEILLEKGKFDEVYALIDEITLRESGSQVIRDQAELIRKDVVEAEEEWIQLQKEVDFALNLAEKGSYEASNRVLKDIVLNTSNDLYYQSIKTDLFEKIAENEKDIAKLQEENTNRGLETGLIGELKKLEATSIENQIGETKEQSMFYWTDEEVEVYMSELFSMDREQLVIDIHNRTEESYFIEVKQSDFIFDEAYSESAPILGLFKVKADGILLKMDMMSEDYIPLD